MFICIFLRLHHSTIICSSMVIVFVIDLASGIYKYYLYNRIRNLEMKIRLKGRGNPHSISTNEEEA